MICLIFLLIYLSLSTWVKQSANKEMFFIPFNLKFDSRGLERGGVCVCCWSVIKNSYVGVRL